MSNSVHINPNILNLKESATLKINTRVREMRQKGEDVIHFGFGQSPFPVHPKIVQSLRDHADKKDYLSTKGLPQLRSNISEFYKENFNYDFDPENVLIGPGSKELIFQALFVLEGPVIVPAPSWVSYGPQVYSKGKQISVVKTQKKNNYRLQGEELSEFCKTLPESQKLLILNSPNNPVGSVYTDKELEAIAEICRDQNIIVISDEIYGLIDFTGERKKGIYHFYPEGTLVTGGISKSHSAGGYRMGFLATSSHLNGVINALSSLISETFSAVAAPIQYAAVGAFAKDSDILDYINRCTAIHKQVSFYIYDRLNQLGIGCSKPEGAFYLLADFNDFKLAIKEKLNISTSEEMAKHLLKTYNIAMLPGSDFYMDNDDLSFRIATVDYDGANVIDVDHIRIDHHMPNIKKGIQALEHFVDQLCGKL